MKQTDSQVGKESSLQSPAGELAETVADRPAQISPSSIEGHNRSLFEQVPLMCFVVDAQGTVLRVNRQGAEELGYRPEELLGRSVLGVFRPEDHSAVLRHLADCLSAQWIPKSWELQKIRKDGTLLSVNEFARTTKDAEGNIQIFIACENITDRKQAEAALRESEARFRTLIETAGAAIVGLSPEGHIRAWNRAAEQLYGWPKTEVIGKDYFELFLPESVRQGVIADFQKVLRGEPTREFENPVRTRDGQERLLSWNVDRLTGDRGEPIGVIAVGQDVTERKRAADDLRHSHEQLRDLTARLLSDLEEERTRISRDVQDQLGQILTALNLDIEWVRERLSSAPPTVRDRLRVMAGLVETMGQSVRTICTALRPVVLDQLGLLPAIARQAAEFQARTGVTCEINCLLQRVNLDSERSTALFRMCQEILTNVARHANATAVTIAVSEEFGHLALKVRDNGRGISDAELADPKSLGLRGLRERAMAFGGTVTIRGSRGEGTAITATMPQSEAMSAEQ